MSNGQHPPKPYAGHSFEHDIFVSYSHGPDDGGRESELTAWTHALVTRLRENISLSLENQREEVDVWYDAKLRGNVALTDALKIEVERSATLLIVMTGRYLSSDWCEKERAWFEAEITRRGADIKNVFVVRAMPTKSEDWPDFLKDSSQEQLLGFRFCDESEGKAARPYGWVDPPQSSTYKQFVDSLTKLATDIATRLDEIRASGPAPDAVEVPADVSAAAGGPVGGSAGSPSGGPRGPVFIAPGTEDVRQLVDDLRARLAEKGCSLYPPAPARIEDFVPDDQSLKTAKAFVQFIGMMSAKDEGSAEGRVQSLYGRATNCGARFLRRDAAVPLAALAYDKTYMQFVESLGDLPSPDVPLLAEEIVKYLAEQEATAAQEDTEADIVAFLNLPAEALDEFETWRDLVDAEHCILFPRKPPTTGQVAEIQEERKSRQLVFGRCNVVLMMYCVSGQLDWLYDAVVDYEKDSTKARREKHRCAVPVIVDVIGEAGAMAKELGIDHVMWPKDADASELWNQVRPLAQ